jgi:uncharacterized protein
MDDHFPSTSPDAQGRIGSSSSGFPGSLFLKKSGLRAGWRLLIYAALFLVLWSFSAFVLGLIFRPAPDVFSPDAQLFAESSSFLSAFLAAWIMSLLEERPVGVYGLPLQEGAGKLFCQGGLFGLIEICTLIGIMAAFGCYSFGRLTEHGAGLARWASFWAVFFLVVALFEEFFFRGYALFTLADGIGFWPAAVLLSLFFGGVHLRNPGEGWAGVVGVILVGLLWCFVLKRTGSLWFAVGMHAAFDFGETFLFSVPDSGMIFPGHLSNATLHGPTWITGGTPGPEASVFDFLILIIFFVAVHYLYPAKPSRRSTIEFDATV